MTDDERLGSLVAIYKEHFGETAEVIFDCGTRDGDDAAYLKEKLNAKSVYAIDANPLAVAETRRLHPDLIVIETALSDFVGETTFTQIQSERKDFAGSSSFVSHQNFDGAKYSKIVVSVTTMAQLLDDLGIDGGIDLVKVDLEGYSYEFLKGMGEHLRKVKVLHLETETFERHEGHHNNEEVKALMSEAGFRLAEVSYEWGPRIEDQVWVNTAIE
jgi:FkbM family methyltransferase